MEMNVVNWFEIPVSDMARAKAFYTGVFQRELQDLNMPDIEMAMFPMNENAMGTSGALVKYDQGNPGGNGITIYFTCADCSVEAGRVEENGGKLVQPKTSIGEFGFIAMAMDTEGNMIGLHSQT